MDARKLRRIIAWSWIVFVCLSVPAFAQVSREPARGMHTYGDALFLDATALTGTWTCDAGKTACTGSGTDAVNEGLSAGDVVLCQSGSDYVDYEVASSPAVTATSFSRTSTITTWSGDIVAEDLSYAISGTCYIANEGGGATEKRIYDGLGHALDAAIGTASVTVRTQLNIGTAGNLDLTNSTGTLCVSNGDGSGCDGNLSANDITAGSSGEFYSGGTCGSSTSADTSCFGHTAILYEGDEADNDELRIDLETAFNAYDTSGVDGDVTISVPARSGDVALITYVENTSPSEPFTCGASTKGAIVYVDDTDDTLYSAMCTCAYLDGTGYDWRDMGDMAGTACPFF